MGSQNRFLSFINMHISRGYLAFDLPQIARFRFMFLSCSFGSKEVFLKTLAKSDSQKGSFFAKLPDFLGKINRFSLLFSFRANLQQNVIEEKRFVGKFYIV